MHSMHGSVFLAVHVEKLWGPWRCQGDTDVVHVDNKVNRSFSLVDGQHVSSIYFSFYKLDCRSVVKLKSLCG